jgi:hypothetical protein
MRRLPAICLFISISIVTAAAQIMPKSRGSCGVAASSVASCDWVSAINTRRAATSQTTGETSDLAHDSGPTLFVTTFILAPAAPLDSRQIVGGEVLIVGRNKGEVVNEKKSPPARINVYEGLVMLMPKDEPYLLRNIGKDNLELLLIEIRKPACPDPNLRQAKIGGEAITGNVRLHNKPFGFALVWLYSVSGTFGWVGLTDKDGGFVTTKLPPGEYHLEVDGWGSTTIQLDPNLDKSFGGQNRAWSLWLMDDGCVGTGMNMD